MAITNKSLQSSIAHYRQASDTELPDARRKLGILFYELTKEVIEGWDFALTDKDEAIQEGVMICFEKLNQWRSELGGKAFNYFTTCIVGHLCQLYRTRKHIKEFYGQ